MYCDQRSQYISLNSKKNSFHGTYSLKYGMLQNIDRTLCCIFLRRCGFGVKTRVIIKILDSSLLPKKLWLIFMGMKQTFFFAKKNQNGRLEKYEIFKITNSQNNFARISGIVLGLIGLIYAKSIDVTQPKEWSKKTIYCNFSLSFGDFV